MKKNPKKTRNTSGVDMPLNLKLVTEDEGDQKAPFSIATTSWCRGGRYSFPRIAPLYL